MGRRILISEQTASMEDYLEAIAKLHEEESEVTVTQISKRLGVKKPSVTSALHKLSEDGLVQHPKYGTVELTRKGQKIADEVVRRHEVLFLFLSQILGIDQEIAQEDACKIEHLLSPSSLERLAKFVEFVLSCPRGEPAWLEGFTYYFEHGQRDEDIMSRCQWKDR